MEMLLILFGLFLRLGLPIVILVLIGGLIEKRSPVAKRPEPL